MKEFEIIRKMNDLADEIDNLLEVRGRLVTSDLTDILTTIDPEDDNELDCVFLPYISLPKTELLKLIESQMFKVENEYKKLKTQLFT